MNFIAHPGCSRGLPQYEGTGPFNLRQPISCTTSGIGCNSNNYGCETIGSKTICCSKRRDFVCSSQGGLPLTTNTSPNVGVPLQPIATVPRFYYNSVRKACVLFNWNQQGGDFNNFATLQDCESYCSASNYSY